MKPSLPVILLALLTPTLLQAQPATERPNILFVFADDWGRYASVFAEHEKNPSANQVVKTPNIDRVAKDGILFRRAFVNAPSCTPCRSSLLSGRYFFRTGRGAILQGAEWDANIPSWPLLLRDAGYHIGKTAKVWSPGTPADAPFGMQKYAYQKSGMLFNNFSEEVTKARAGGTSLEAARDVLLKQVEGNFADFLKAQPEGSPFCYWFGTTTTHRVWIKGSGKALWAIDPDSLKGKLPKFLPDVPEVREDFADYLGEVQALDAYVGVLLKKLEQSGQADRTMIVLSGDHGAPGFPNGKCNLYDFGVGVTLAVKMPGGKGGRVVDDLVSLIDLCPTILEVGRAKLPEGMDGRSLLPLLKSDRSGQVEAERTWVICGRERHVESAREGNLPYPMRSLRTPDFLYIRNFMPDRTPMGDAGKGSTEAELTSNTRLAFADMDAGPTKAWLIIHRDDPKVKPFYDAAFGKRPAEELYDLKSDPDQVKNLASDPEYAARRKELGERLLKILKDAKDPRVAEGECIYDKPPFTDGRKQP